MHFGKSLDVHRRVRGNNNKNFLDFTIIHLVYNYNTILKMPLWLQSVITKRGRYLVGKYSSKDGPTWFNHSPPDAPYFDIFIMPAEGSK